MLQLFPIQCDATCTNRAKEEMGRLVGKDGYEEEGEPVSALVEMPHCLVAAIRTRGRERRAQIGVGPPAPPEDKKHLVPPDPGVRYRVLLGGDYVAAIKY